MKAVVLLLLCIVGVFADVYMQNPRGSNNRLNEANADATNQNRMFDSENNARGGYAWGPAMTYIAGSQLPIQWTAQHGCGSNQVECNIIIQYMCVDGSDPTTTIRDGLTTTTIQDNAATYNQKSTVNGVTDYTYGMHESYQYYQDCKGRARNQGLFTADQNLNGVSARFTRQDAAGTQYGFECNEERDYYPYWGPSPWKDIAIMAPSDTLCSYFKAESQNVKARGACTGATTSTNTNNNVQPITQSACTAAGGTWNVIPSFGIAAPDCQLAQYSRDNHLGNTLDGDTATYNWTIPSNEPCIGTGNCDCALRIRYNVSNSQTTNYPPATFTDSTQNGKTGAVTANPVQQVEGDDLKMALNPDQYGRTFQDRSYTFKITPRPANIDASTPIYNLNVRGKRGNIVQTFPATEYDFVPNNLQVNEGDYIHFQWTGSDYNPNGNAGEGIDGTDRSNIVQVSSLNSNLPLTQDQVNSGSTLFDNADLRHYMALTGQTNCPTYAAVLAKNGGNEGNADVDPTNCAKLNAAPPHFDAGPIKVNKTGTFYYMSTRNNNFSNRTQKGLIVVSSKPLSSGAIAAIVICSVLGAAGLAVGGTYFYARKFPNSKIAGVYSKLPKNPFSKGSASSSGDSMPYAVNGDNKKPLLA